MFWSEAASLNMPYWMVPVPQAFWMQAEMDAPADEIRAVITRVLGRDSNAPCAPGSAPSAAAQPALTSSASSASNPAIASSSSLSTSSSRRAGRSLSSSSSSQLTSAAYSSVLSRPSSKSKTLVPRACGLCAPGTYSFNGLACSPCFPGQVAKETGSTYCSTCPSDT